MKILCSVLGVMLVILGSIGNFAYGGLWPAEQWNNHDFHVDELIEQLQHEDSSKRSEAVEYLYFQPRGEWTRAVESLIERLTDEDEIFYFRATAARALANIGDSRAIEPLITTLQHELPFVRRFVAESLGNLRAVQAVDPLRMTLRNDNKMVRAYTAKASGKIGDGRAVEP